MAIVPLLPPPADRHPVLLHHLLEHGDVAGRNTAGKSIMPLAVDDWTPSSWGSTPRQLASRSVSCTTTCFDQQQLDPRRAGRPGVPRALGAVQEPQRTPPGGYEAAPVGGGWTGGLYPPPSWGVRAARRGSSRGPDPLRRSCAARLLALRFRRLHTRRLR